MPADRKVSTMLNGDVEVYTPATGKFSRYRAQFAFGSPTWRHVSGPDLGPIEMARLGITTNTARIALNVKQEG